MQCKQFLEIADSYLGNELNVETNHSVISHLDHCHKCRRELTARHDLLTRLRTAFINAPENRPRPEFANLLRIQLHDRALSTTNPTVVSATHRLSSDGWQKAALRFAACLLLATVIGMVVVREWRTHENVMETTSTLVNTELATSATGDHRDCAVHFRLPEKPIDLDEAGRKFDPAYINLSKAVLSGGIPNRVEFVEAHSCVFGTRRFAHLVFRYKGQLVSLLVTGNGDAAKLSQPTPTTIEQHAVIACSQFDSYRVSCFQTAQHAVFVVSDLSEGDNLMLARALAPSLVTHITRTERTT